MDLQMAEPDLARFREAIEVRNNVFIALEDQMESYIVRIYRRDGNDTKKVAGVVEEIGGEGKTGFLGPDSLWKILTTPRREPEPDRKTLRRGKTPWDERWDAMTFTEILMELNREEE